MKNPGSQSDALLKLLSHLGMKGLPGEEILKEYKI